MKRQIVVNIENRLGANVDVQIHYTGFDVAPTSELHALDIKIVRQAVLDVLELIEETGAGIPSKPN